MATTFYTLPIHHIDKTTSDCVVLSFQVDESLKKQFQFKQGQYLTLQTEIDGIAVRRSYSLCSSPMEEEWKVAIKKVPGGVFSTYANDVLQVGDTLEVLPPNGRFYKAIEVDSEKNYVAFAAGSGITPILSIIKTHLQAEPKSTFRLFYINQRVSSIILKEELEALKNKYFNRFELFHFLTKAERDLPLFNGRLSEEKLDIIFEKLVHLKEIDDFFICGPEAMLFLVRDYLLDHQVDKKNIHFELFTSATAKNKAVKNGAEIQTNGKTASITILEGGKSMQFELPLGTDNILDAALNQSADLPFACKGGVCCTCRAKLIEGEVEMAVNYALEEEEVEAGFILTCQSRPISEKVVVDFDV